MKNSALVVIDLQNDITKNYKEIITKVNEAIDWAEQKELWIVYIQHNNLSAGGCSVMPLQEIMEVEKDEMTDGNGKIGGIIALEFWCVFHHRGSTSRERKSSHSAERREKRCTLIKCWLSGLLHCGRSLE